MVFVMVVGEIELIILDAVEVCDPRQSARYGETPAGRIVRVGIGPCAQDYMSMEQSCEERK